MTYLVNSLAESIKLAKDVHLREIKWSCSRHLLNLLLGLVETLLVLLVETGGRQQFDDEILVGLVPDAIVTVVGYVVFTRGHHLVGHLHNQ